MDGQLDHPLSSSSTSLPARVQCIAGALAPSTFFTGSCFVVVAILLLLLCGFLDALRRVVWERAHCCWLCVNESDEPSSDKGSICPAQRSEDTGGKEGTAPPPASVCTSISGRLQRSAHHDDMSPRRQQPVAYHGREALSRLRLYARFPGEVAAEELWTSSGPKAVIRQTAVVATASECRQQSEGEDSRPLLPEEVAAALVATESRLQGEIGDMMRVQEQLTSPDKFATLAMLQRRCQARQRELEIVQERIGQCVPSSKFVINHRNSNRGTPIDGGTEASSANSVSIMSAAPHPSGAVEMEASPASPFGLADCFSERFSHAGRKIWSVGKRPTVLYLTKIIVITAVASKVSHPPSQSYLLLSESPWKNYALEALISKSVRPTSPQGPGSPKPDCTPLEGLLSYLRHCHGAAPGLSHRDSKWAILQEYFNEETQSRRIGDPQLLGWAEFLFACLMTFIVDVGFRQFAQEFIKTTRDDFSFISHPIWGRRRAFKKGKKL